MTYIQHFKFSMNLSKKFAIASAAAAIHAIIPDILVTHSTDTHTAVALVPLREFATFTKRWLFLKYCCLYADECGCLHASPSGGALRSTAARVGIADVLSGAAVEVARCTPPLACSKRDG